MAAAAAAARDPFEEKLIRVTIWLRKIYGDIPVPQYEVNEKTVDILHGVMECNEERDRDIALVIEDMKDLAAKYEAKAQYWDDIIRGHLGLEVGALSEEALEDLIDLMDCAIELKVEDTSLTSFYSAINNMTSELFKTTSKNEEMEWKVKTVTKKLTAALRVQKKLEEDINKIEEFHNAENARAEVRSRNLKFLRDKSMDIKIRIADAQKELIDVGLDQSLTHEALMKLSKEVAALQKKMAPLKKELAAYHGLPLSIPLARVKVEEAKKEVNDLEEELTREILALPFELT